MTPDTVLIDGKNTRKHPKQECKKSVLSQKVTTRLKETDMIVWQRQTQITKTKKTKAALPWNNQ